MNYPFSIIIDEYSYILTRLGATISTDIEMWLSLHKNDPILYNKLLHFTTINQAMQFTSALVNNDFDNMKAIYIGQSVDLDDKITLFDKIAFSLSLYFHYQQFSQYSILKYWLLITNDPISLELVYIKKMFLDSRNLFLNF